MNLQQSLVKYTKIQEFKRNALRRGCGYKKIFKLCMIIFTWCFYDRAIHRHGNDGVWRYGWTLKAYEERNKYKNVMEVLLKVSSSSVKLKRMLKATNNVVEVVEDTIDEEETHNLSVGCESIYILNKK